MVEILSNKLYYLNLSIPLNGFPALSAQHLFEIPIESFNSIERILHHHGLCCVWKFFHFHSYGFYSIKPPGGGLMIIVSARVYKRFSLIPQGFSHAVSWDFQLYTVRTLFNG